ncbi:MAG: DUF997 family protein [Planctomycetaceae bacterium]
MDNSSSQPRTEEFAPVFLNSRREAYWIFCVWAIGLVWAVPFCYFNGYDETVDVATFSTTMGIPTWLFWGILVPWIAADIFTVWFCFCFMKDDDLGGDDERSSIVPEATDDVQGELT